MSVLIRGMEMPTSCTVCPFENFGDCYGGKVKAIMDIDDYVSAGKRHPRCPLVPVPDHGRQDGLYQKYFVVKIETGEVVDDCFILRPQKDSAAVAAIQTYSKTTDNRELASDLSAWLSTIIPAEEEE